jgi:site-specific DNA-methyltransferase (adenine-specific)
MTSLDSLRNRILVGDAFEQLQQLPAASIDMVLTSPPYFRLRDYDVAGQLGLESHVDEWVNNLFLVSHELRRVLLPTGTLWLNLGDTYSIHANQGAAKKGLLLGPERLTLALIQDGWLLRNKIVWQKSNPMPSPVRDRLAATWEAVYVFARQPRYFFDLDSIREAHTSSHKPIRQPTPSAEHWRSSNSNSVDGLAQLKARGLAGHPLGKNPGDVWRLASSSYRSAHHATFPISLAKRAIRAGAPETRCGRCHSPWQRSLLRSADGTASRTALGPTCGCGAGRESAVVLDPFFGAGTTAVAAEQLGRDWLGIELNSDFAHQAEQRILSSRPARAGPSTATG